MAPPERGAGVGVDLRPDKGAHRHAPLVPEKRTLKRLEELRSLGAPGPTLVGRALEILQGDRSLSANLEPEMLRVIARRLVDERARKKSAAELIGDAVRERVPVDRPGAALPVLKTAARVVNELLAGDRALPPATQDLLEVLRCVDELRVEKRDGGAQLVARSGDLGGHAAADVLTALRRLLDAYGYGEAEVRLEISPGRTARAEEARAVLELVLQGAAVPVDIPRSPEDVIRRVRDFRVELRGERPYVIGRVFSTEGVTQARILAAARELLRRRGFEDVPVKLELLH